nr:hypothetical protein [Tanacetum cinerariifolium]
MQTQTSNTLHNTVMEAGGKDPQGNYVQWKSRIKRYINTKPNHELIYYCLKNPPCEYTWKDKDVLVTEDNDIYSTVDACPNACKMWKAIERLKQGESINVQDLETNMYWEFGNSHHGMSQELKTVSYHKLFNILKQHQNEVNEIRAERLSRTANPLALFAHQETVYHPQNHPTHYTQNSSTRSQQAATRNRGKAIVNSPPPIYDQEPSMVAGDDEISKDKEIDKLMALISLSFKKIYKPTNNNLRTSSNTSRANQDNSLWISRGTGYDNQRIVIVVGARETVDQELEAHYMYMSQIQEVTPYDVDNFGPIFDSEPLQKRDDTDDESKDQELEAHYMYMAQIQEVSPDAADSGSIFDTEPVQKVPNNDNYNVFAIECEHPEQSQSVHDTYPIEQDEHNVIIDSLDMSYDREQIDQNDDDADLANEPCFHDDIIPFVKNLKELFTSFDQCLIDEVTGVQNIFKQMELAVEQHCAEKTKFQTKMENVLKENDRLLRQALSVEIVNIVVHDYVNFDCLNVDAYAHYRDTMSSPESAPTFAELFEINDLKAQVQEKDTVILKLKEKIKSFSGDVKERKVKRKVEEIEKLNLELDHKVTKLAAENEHLKQIYKQLFNLIKSSRVQSKEHCDDLINKVNLKSVEVSDLNASLQEKVFVIIALKEQLNTLKGKAVLTEFVSLNPIDPALLQVDVAPLVPKLRKNRTAHTDYIRHTQEEAATLREIVESERLLSPLNTSLAYA